MAAAATVQDEFVTVDVVLDDKTRVAAEIAAVAASTSLPELMQTLLFDYLVETGQVSESADLAKIA